MTFAAPLLLAASLSFAPPPGLSGVAAERAAEDALEAKLDAPPPEWSEWPDLKGKTLPNALAAFGLAVGVSVVLDRTAFGQTAPEELAFTPPTPFPFDRNPPPTVRAAFGALLDSQNGPALALENRSGLLRVTTPAVAAANLSPRVYDVRGLSEALGLTDADAARGTVVQRIAGRGAGAAPVVLDPPLIAALKTGVGPAPGVADWDVAGGPAAIAELGGRLVVRQSPAGHAALARLLDDLRAGGENGAIVEDEGPAE